MLVFKVCLCSNKILLPNFYMFLNFGLRKKKPLSILVRKGKFQLALPELPPRVSRNTSAWSVVAWYKISTLKMQIVSWYRILTRKGIVNIQTNENIFGEVGCLLVYVIFLVWGCCYFGRGVEMVPKQKSKKDLILLSSKNYLLRGWVSRACLQVSRPKFAWKEDSQSLSWRETSPPSTVWRPHRTSVAT